MENVSGYLGALFIATTLLSIFFFFVASKKSKIVLAILLVWLTLQAVFSLSGFYKVTNTIPPRFALLVTPPLLFIIVLFTTNNGKRFIDGLDIRLLTLLHIVRILVEIVLLGLSMNKVVPQLMTFEGRNFDILSGLTAPLIYYFGFIKGHINKKGILVWNFVCLALLLNIVVNAILSAPFPFQKFAFDQPNIAVLYFPFIWLPCCIVPIVLLSHLASIRQLTQRGIQ